MLPLNLIQNPSPDFKEQLETFLCPGIWTGHLIVTKEGTLTQTDFLHALWEKFKGMLGFENRTDDRHLLSGTIKFLKNGMNCIKTEKDAKMVKALAERVGLVPSKNNDPSALDVLVNEICNPILNKQIEKKREELQKELVNRVFTYHEEDLSPLPKGIFKITQTFDNVLPAKNEEDAGKTGNESTTSEEDTNNANSPKDEQPTKSETTPSFETIHVSETKLGPSLLNIPTTKAAEDSNQSIRDPLLEKSTEKNPPVSPINPQSKISVDSKKVLKAEVLKFEDINSSWKTTAAKVGMVVVGFSLAFLIGSFITSYTNRGSTFTPETPPEPPFSIFTPETPPEPPFSIFTPKTPPEPPFSIFTLETPPEPPFSIFERSSIENYILQGKPENFQNPKICVFTSYTTTNPERLEMSRKVAVNQKGYSTQKGYSYLEYQENLAVETDPISGEIKTWEPYWSKIAAINKILNDKDSSLTTKPEWIVWMDDDAIITNDAIRMEDVINHYTKDNKDLNFLVTTDSQSHLNQDIALNSAVLFIKNNDWSRHFFEEVWKMRNIKVRGEPYTYGNCPNQSCLHEQQAITYLLAHYQSFKQHSMIIPQRDPEFPVGINTFVRWNHVDLNRHNPYDFNMNLPDDKKARLKLNFDSDRKETKGQEKDFIQQCTGLSTRAHLIDGSGKVNEKIENLRLKCINQLLGHSD